MTFCTPIKTSSTVCHIIIIVTAIYHNIYTSIHKLSVPEFALHHDQVQCGS